MSTTVVKINTCDGIIWNKPTVVLEIIAASLKSDNVVLDLLDEAPCCEEIGINSMLSEVINKFHFDPNIYTIHTGNMLKSSPYKEVKVKIAELTFVKDCINDMTYSQALPEFKHKLGIFVGRSNWQRLGIASYIWSNCNNPKITFHYDHTSEYHRRHLGLEELITRHWDDKDTVNHFLSTLPMKDISTHVEYPILYNKGAFDLVNDYKHIFCDVVCETFFSGRTFLMTEKTMRSIMFKRPFLIQGPKWFLLNLKNLGFKTFDKWWDEKYDESPSDARYETFKDAVTWIEGQETATINRWYKEMEPILNHNLNTLKTLTDEKILNTEFFYE